MDVAVPNRAGGAVKFRTVSPERPLGVGKDAKDQLICLTDEEKSQTRSSEEFNFEKDSLHLLPLEIIPLQLPALSRALLVKNVRIGGMVEVFRGQGMGSGKVDPVTLEQVFDIAEDERITDADKIRSLCGLTRFEVYSLRIQLRTLGIDVDDIENLRLSKEKRSQ